MRLLVFTLLCSIPALAEVGGSFQRDGTFVSDRGPGYIDYRNETVGFSLTLPNGWQSRATGEEGGNEIATRNFYPPTSLSEEASPTFQRVEISEQWQLNGLSLEDAAAELEKAAAASAQYENLQRLKAVRIDGCEGRSLLYRFQLPMGLPLYVHATLLHFDGQMRLIAYAACFDFRERPDFEVFKEILASYHAFGSAAHPKGMGDPVAVAEPNAIGSDFGDALLTRLLSQHAHVREAARGDLANAGNIVRADIIPRLVSAMQGQNNNLQAQYAADALQSMATEPLVIQKFMPEMMKMAQQGDESLIAPRAIDVMIAMGPTVQPLLLEILKDEEAQRRAVAAEVLGRMPGTRALLPTLQQRLNSPVPEIKTGAELALLLIVNNGKMPVPGPDMMSIVSPVKEPTPPPSPKPLIVLVVSFVACLLLFGLYRWWRLKLLQ